MLGQNKNAPTIGSFVVFQVTDEGLSRVLGNRTDSRLNDAIAAAVALASNHPGHHYTVLRVEGSFWHTPKPEILTDMERHESAQR